MGYLRELYGKRSQDFIDGVKAGIIMHATWKDGKEVVGCMQKPLKEVLEDVDKELGEK